MYNNYDISIVNVFKLGQWLMHNIYTFISLLGGRDIHKMSDLSSQLESTVVQAVNSDKRAHLAHKTNTYCISKV